MLCSWVARATDQIFVTHITTHSPCKMVRFMACWHLINVSAWRNVLSTWRVNPIAGDINTHVDSTKEESCIWSKLAGVYGIIEFIWCFYVLVFEIAWVATVTNWLTLTRPWHLISCLTSCIHSFFVVTMIYSEINLYALRMIKKKCSSSYHLPLPTWAVHPEFSADPAPPLGSKFNICIGLGPAPLAGWGIFGDFDECRTSFGFLGSGMMLLWKAHISNCFCYLLWN